MMHPRDCKYVFCVMTVAVASMLCSCRQSTPVNNRQAEIVAEHVGRKIVWPDQSIFKIMGHPADKEWRDADFKIVTYIDNEGCVACRMKLAYWNELIARLDTLSPRRVAVVHYIVTDDKQSVGEIIRRFRYHGIVAIDSVDRFSTVNPMPSDTRYRTMLLDRDDRIIAVGSPVLNPAIRDLYISVITNDALPSSDSDVTEVDIPVTSIDLGIVRQGKDSSCVFKIVNVGDNRLEIREAVTSCDCTSVGFSPSSAMPGDTIYVTVTYNDDDIGEFYREVTLFGNMPAAARLEISGRCVASDDGPEGQ